MPNIILRTSDLGCCRGTCVADIFHTSETIKQFSSAVKLTHYPRKWLYGFAQVDHKLYFSSNEKPFLKDDWGLANRNYFTFQKIQSSSSAEDHGVSGDPLFVDAGQNDFYLQAASLAISEADSNQAPLTDKDGNSRDSQPDIVAYEYQGDSTDNILPLAPQNLRATPL